MMHLASCALNSATKLSVWNFKECMPELKEMCPTGGSTSALGAKGVPGSARVASVLQVIAVCFSRVCGLNEMKLAAAAAVTGAEGDDSAVDIDARVTEDGPLHIHHPDSTKQYGIS